MNLNDHGVTKNEFFLLSRGLQSGLNHSEMVMSSYVNFFLCFYTCYAFEQDGCLSTIERSKKSYGLGLLKRIKHTFHAR